ncbi:MAG: TonB-dependent receptor [Gemmatimonadota bacterium]
MSTCVRVPRCGAALAAVVTAVVLICLAPAELEAQTGQVRGQVTSEGDGDFLPGAQVALEGTSLGAVTDRNGRYRIEGVPVGDYTLVVSYLGYDEFRADVSVSDDEIEEQNASIEASFVQAEGITVQLRQGQAKALMLQRTSSTIVNIVDQEQIQLFPDLNTAEVLQRVPGVNIRRSLGEGQFVFIRGTEPRFTSVTVNGQKIATPADAERFVPLDVISANQLASLKVTKALTPDMDADAIGGTVDLVTRSAFDMESSDRYFQLTGGGGYSELGDEPLYQSTLTFSDLFADDKFGFTINANYNQINRISHNNEIEWGDIETVDEVEIPFALTDLQLRRYDNQRDRYGVNADLEYRPRERSRFFVRGMYNKRDDYQYRNLSRFQVDQGDYLSPTSVTGSRLVRGMQDRTETQLITNIAAGGDHTFERWLVDYTMAYSYAEQDKDGQIIPEFRLNEDVDLEVDLSNPNTPGFTITNLDAAYVQDPANYELNGIDFRNEFTSDRETILALNLEYPYVIGDNSASLKFGGKARYKNKDRHDQRWEYSWEGDEEVTLESFATDAVDEPFLDGAYEFGPTIDVDEIRDFFAEHRNGLLEEEVRFDDSIGDAYEAGEHIYATYAMTRMQLGRLMVLGGARHEFTSTDYSGTRLMFDVEGEFVDAVPVDDDRSYNHFFPMAQLRYAITNRTNLRFAGTTGIARPNYFDLVPYFMVFPEDEEIIRGNSELDPTYAVSWDLLGEHYFEGIGILSAGVFYKALDDIIYIRQFEETEGPFVGFDVEQPVNGGSANLYGVELNWQQQFTFLPGFWSGFGIYGNYTYTKSEADLLFRDWTTLPGQASDSGNLAFTYEGYGLDARISMNFNGKFIDEVGDSPAEDEIIDDHVQWDFSSSYSVMPQLDLYFNVVNLTDEPRRDYVGVSSRPRQREFYSWWSTFGIKFTP